MDKFKTELRELRPKLIVVTYAALMLIVALNIGTIWDFVVKVLAFFNPLFLAIGIAFTLNVPMMALERLIIKHTKEGNIINRFKRPVAIVGAIVIIIALVIFLGIVVIPDFFNSIGNVFINLATYLNSISENIASIFKGLDLNIEHLTSEQIELWFANLGLNYSDILKEASNWIMGTGQGAFDYLVAAGNSLFMFMMSFTISIYLLASKETFVLQLKKVIVAVFPKEMSDEILACAKIANGIFTNFIGGKCVECLMVGLMVYLCMFLAQAPFALLIACLCGFFTIIPVFGSLIATIIGCILLLSVNIWWPIVFFLLYWLVQIIDGNFLYPKFIGSGMGLPAVWILTSILIFGSIYGIMGTLLAAPTTACLYAFFTDFINNRLKKKGIDMA